MWYKNLQNTIRKDDSFYIAMNHQLSNAFSILTNESIEEYQLLPPFPDNFEIKKLDDKDIQTIEGDLVGPQMGYPVIIAWFTDKEGKPKFWWLELPFTEINFDNELFRKSWKELLPDTVEIENPIWPHITVKGILLDSPKITKEDFKKLLEENLALNDMESKEGTVHSIKEIDLKKTAVRVKIDFGSANVNTLKSLIRFLIETLQIEKITIS